MAHRRPPPARSEPFPTRGRGGFSLTELLVASAIGLMVMAAVASLFGVFGSGVRGSQAIVDLNARLRSAAWYVRQDLHGVTTQVTPWVRPEAGGGYFQVIQGPAKPPNSLIGDVEDVLAMTVMSLGGPFAGRIPNTGLESPVAEVVWFCRPSNRTFADQPLYNLHRRQLLVSATPGAGDYERRIRATTINRNLHDLSCRANGVANSLADLTTPANRFWTQAAGNPTLQGQRQGDDIILTNVLTFDVKTLTDPAAAYGDAPFNTNYQDGGAPAAGQPLLGVQVTIRCLEPASRQIRQMTVVHSFVR